jgi:hypothetical protein
MDQSASTLCRHVRIALDLICILQILNYSNRGGYFIQFEQDFFPSTSSTDKRNLANDPLSFPVSADQLFELVSKFQLNVPFISEEDISDRSKADVFTKAFAVAQSAWLVIQCIARRADNLREWERIVAAV